MENTLENNGKTCDSHTRRVERLLMRVHVLAMDTFTWNLCEIQTKESGRNPFRKWVKNAQQPKQHCYEKGSSMTQKEGAKCSPLGNNQEMSQIPCVTVTQKSGKVPL